VYDLFLGFFRWFGNDKPADAAAASVRLVHNLLGIAIVTALYAAYAALNHTGVAVTWSSVGIAVGGAVVSSLIRFLETGQTSPVTPPAEPLPPGAP
jgi:hypothetical protein